MPLKPTITNNDLKFKSILDFIDNLTENMFYVRISYSNILTKDNLSSTQKNKFETKINTILKNRPKSSYLLQNEDQFQQFNLFINDLSDAERKAFDIMTKSRNYKEVTYSIRSIHLPINILKSMFDQKILYELTQSALLPNLSEMSTQGSPNLTHLKNQTTWFSTKGQQAQVTFDAFIASIQLYLKKK